METRQKIYFNSFWRKLQLISTTQMNVHQCQSVNVKMKRESHKLTINFREQISFQRIKADQRQWILGGRDYKSVCEQRETVPGGQLTDSEECVSIERSRVVTGSPKMWLNQFNVKQRLMNLSFT